MFLKVPIEWALVTLADGDVITLQGSDKKKELRWRLWVGAFVPVVNLVLMVELFWGPFSAKSLSTYSVAGSRLVSTYSTVFPDTVLVISGTRRETQTPKQLPLLV